MAPRSHIGTALAAGPNRTAAVAPAAIALAVLALGRLPISIGSEVDLRAAEHVDGWAQVSLFGFGPPTPSGRTLPESGRIVWNRPLPERFTLALDIASDAPRARIAVSLGDRRQVVALARDRPAHIAFENPLGLRELRVAPVPPGAHLRLRRVAVR